MANYFGSSYKKIIQIAQRHTQQDATIKQKTYDNSEDDFSQKEICGKFEISLGKW